MSNKSKPEGTLKPSQVKLVHFADGKVVTMNRRDRRRNKIYGSRLMKPGTLTGSEIPSLHLPSPEAKE